MKLDVEFDAVVVNYNSGDALKTCLQRLQQPGTVASQITVVDNASTDHSLETIADDKQHIQLVKQKKNTGFAQASNLGASQGKSAYLAIINPDCFVRADQILQLIEGLRSRKQAALIGCRVLNEDGSLQAASRRRLPTFWRVFCHQTRLSKLPLFNGINIKDNGKFAELQAVSAVNGACLVMERDVFERLDGFDENYPLHFEDLDLFIRIQQAGKTILYDASVEVHHLKGHSKQDPKHIKEWKRAGLMRFFKLHRPAWEHRIMQFILGSK